MHKLSLLGFLWLAFFGISYAADSAFISIPTCQTRQLITPTTSDSGLNITSTRGEVFCTAKDFKADAAESSRLISELKARLSGRTIQDLRLSAFYFSSPEVARWICVQHYTSDAKLTIFNQTSTGREHLSPEFTAAMESCPIIPRFLEVGCNVFGGDEANDAAANDSETAVCRRGRVNILHTKLVWMRLDNNQVVMAAGSGNFSRSLYANIEDWIVFQRPIGSSLERQLYCIFDTLYENAGVPELAVSYVASLYRGCVSSWGASAGEENIRFSMLPSDDDSYRDTIVKTITSASELTIVPQLLTEPAIINALNQTSAKVRIILDDDYYWALKKQERVGVISYQEALPLATLLAKPGVEVRYLQTNHKGDDAFTNTLHTRLIFAKSQEKAVVITGSPHLKAGSFRLNFENVAVLSDVAMTNSYQSDLDQLWSRGIPEPDMPTQDIPVVRQ
ncbi:phospholipase D-like domain-containing protein [Rhizobium sp. LjRoot98]|uniref:phospholipase D-like domain-containing protein n=1 Tax=Rhizobium sp. LjRoot98 TaxID=3342345 RepID=UPI003F4F50FA